jgi:L-xylulokinase
MGRYLMGIDNGLTVSKAAIFDLDGHEVAVAGRKTETTYPHPGWTERDMEALWRTTADAIRQAIAQAGIDAGEILAIGNSAHGNGIYLLDCDGQILRQGIASLDTRAAAIVQEWYASGVHAQVFPQTLQSLWASQPPALLAWLKRHEPDVYARIGAALQCKDYVKYRLTGTLTTDFTDASGISLLDAPNRCYSQSLLDAFGIGEMMAALPRPIWSHEVAGYVTREAAEASGLTAGTPVVGGMFDVDAAPVASGIIDEGTLGLVSGTWGINEVVTRAPIVDPNLFMTTLFAAPGRWLTIDGSATSATNLEWFVTQFCGEERAEAAARGVSVYDICNEIVAGLPGTDIIFHPFLYGSNVQATARAGFYGLAGWHTKAHVLRALYEGVVYGHLAHVDKLRAAGAQIRAARFTGGGSHSLVWTQMFADALGLVIEVPDGSEVSARGGAMAAGIAAGVYRDYAEAVERAVRLARRHEPDPAKAAYYREHYAEYNCLATAMSEPWERLAHLAVG